MITEKYDGQIGFLPSFDSVFVTTPAGITTAYSIPNYIGNPSSHDSQFNIILNGVIGQGYRVMEMGDWYRAVNNSLMGGNYIFEMRTIFLGQPWTSAGLEPVGANNSPFEILEAFPNPCKNLLNVKFSVNTEDAVLVIINSAGYIVEKIQLRGSDFISTDFSRFSKGTYFIRLINSNYYSEAIKVVREWIPTTRNRWTFE
jgi:hypothetical protein